MRRRLTVTERQAVLDMEGKQTREMNPIIPLASSSGSFLAMCLSAGDTGGTVAQLSREGGLGSQGGAEAVFCGKE